MALQPSLSATVSVVIPVFNGQDYLADAVASATAQTFADLEILIIDDGSTDATPEVAAAIADSRVRLLRQERTGAAAARNRGIAAARGELIALLDADDLWLPAKIERQVTALREGRGDLIFTRVEEFVSPDLEPAEAARLAPRIAPEEGRIPTSFLGRRSDFEAVGPFDPALKLGEFIDWFGRAEERGLRSWTVPERLVRRRLHRGNQGRSNHDNRRQYAQVLKRMLDRRRAAEPR